MKTRTITRLFLVLGLCLILLPFPGCNGGGGDGDGETDRFTIEYAQLQYRNFENSEWNAFHGLVGIADDGGPALETDMTDSDLTNSSGTSQISTSEGFYSENAYDYDCRGGDCTESGPTELTGLWAKFDLLEADTYTIELEMVNEQTLSTDVDYAGMVTIPFIASSTMQSELVDGALELSWTLPTEEENWDQVDQLRVTIRDGSPTTVIRINLDATANSVTIPASLVTSAQALGDGILADWNIQTRAYDADNMCYARGYSNTMDLAGTEPFTADYAMIQYRTFENSDDNVTRGLVGISNDGDPIQPSDVVGTTVTDSGGGSVTVNNEGVWTLNTLWYNCKEDPCEQTGPTNESGIWLALDSLTEDIYTIDVEMANGQTLNIDVDYPVETGIPVIDDESMSATWDEGNLDLVWANPMGEENWDEVDEIRIELIDGDGKTVLYAKVNATADRITIPAAVVTDAEDLGDGMLVEWRTQTRAYDENTMNFARGISNKATIPLVAPPVTD